MLPIHNSADIIFFFLTKDISIHNAWNSLFLSSFLNNAVVILFFYEKTNASKGYRGVGTNSNLYPRILNDEVSKFALVIFVSGIPITSK